MANGFERRSKIALFVALGTVAAIALSVVVNYLLLFAENLTSFERSFVATLVVPLLIGVPLLLVLALRSREVERSRAALTRAASYDGMTSFLNRNVFTAMVDLDQRRQAQADRRRGAFMIIELAQLRTIYARHGQRAGDEAVKMIAGIVRSAIRSDDLVGRLGDGEFGIFLPGASEMNARDVGERIAAAVSAAYFAPGGTRAELNITIAGVLFEEEVGFDRLFQAAENELGNEGRPFPLTRISAEEGRGASN
jgi:diguanylate cyclase